MNKVCFRCGRMLDLSEFYKHPRMADGHLNKCKNCTRADSLSRYERKKQEILTVLKAYRKEHPKQTRKYKKAYDSRYPERKAASRAVASALAAGKIAAQPCAVCGRVPAEAHHEDYSKPLDVVWLCPKHHKEHHKLKRRGLQGVF